MSDQKVIRCNSLIWRIGRRKADGKWKAMSVRHLRIPTAFLPFAVSDAVYNQSIVFDDADTAEQYVRGMRA